MTRSGLLFRVAAVALIVAVLTSALHRRWERLNRPNETTAARP